MSRQKTKSVKEEVEEQILENYGEEGIGGSQQGQETDDDAAKALEKTVGTDLHRGEQFSLAEEVDKDERARRTKPKIEPEED